MTKNLDEELCVREEDTIRLILEFLSNRELCISQLSLERETGIYNCNNLNDDLIFLRQLILDGQWDDVLEFVSPLEQQSKINDERFDSKKFHFLIYKHKYVELLCIRSEANVSPYQTIEIAVQDIIECLQQLERYCSIEEYRHLSSLLTIPNLNDDAELRNWNPNSWRLKCFNDCLPLVERFMQTSQNDNKEKVAKNDRLIDLILKGLLYEICIKTVDKRINGDGDNEDATYKPNVLINDCQLQMNFNKFINEIPIDYLKKFSLKNHFSTTQIIEKHEKPALIASWSEMILSTPIKPKVFPHIDVPYTKIKATDLMSKSLNAASLMLTNPSVNTKENLMTMSVCDLAELTSTTLAATGFHLKQIKTKEQEPNIDECSMIRSIDRLFDHDDKFYKQKFDNKPSSSSIKSLKIRDNGDDSGDRIRMNDRMKMTPISEKATPIEDIDLSSMMIKIIDDDSVNNDVMATSYLKMWQKNKNKNKNKDNPHLKNTGKHQSSSLAEKYRNESNKLRLNKTTTMSVDHNNNNNDKGQIDDFNNVVAAGFNKNKKVGYH